jgi:hypothetical protein
VLPDFDEVLQLAFAAVYPDFHAVLLHWRLKNAGVAPGASIALCTKPPRPSGDASKRSFRSGPLLSAPFPAVKFTAALYCGSLRRACRNRSVSVEVFPNVRHRLA